MASFYLNPYTVRAQCNAIKVRLEEDNRNYRIVMTNVIKFINDTRLKSAAYDALKQQMNDYLQIIQYIVNANNCDIADCNSLSNSVGYEVLDGDQIYSMKNYYSRAIQECQAKSDYYNSCVIYAINSENPEISSYYLMMKWYYDSLVWTNSKLYDSWQKKEDSYYAIEVATRSLFSYSALYKNVANQGIQDMGKAFVNGNYVPNLNASWRNFDKESYVIEVEKDDDFLKNLNELIQHEWIGYVEDANGIVIEGYENLDETKMIFKDGFWFKLKKIKDGAKKGKYTISLGGNKKTWNDIKSYLDARFSVMGKSSKKNSVVKWDKLDVKKMSKEGLVIGDKEANKYFKNLDKTDEFSKNLQKWYNSVADGGRAKVAVDTFGETFKKEVNPLSVFDDFKVNPKGMKVLKSLSFAGDIVSVYTNITDNVKENGFTWENAHEVGGDTIQDIITDTAVDFATSAGSTAIGAAIGSFFAPPIGTVVGAVAGIAIDLAINWDVKDIDKDGEKDSLVDKIKMDVDYICDTFF